jgi:hypothetical protein
VSSIVLRTYQKSKMYYRFQSNKWLMLPFALDSMNTTNCVDCSELIKEWL